MVFCQTIDYAYFMSRLAQLQALHKESPEDSFLLFALAKEFEGMGDDEAALQHYLMLSERDPRYVGLYYHLAKLYERRGDAAAAWSTYSKGMETARAARDEHAYRELAGARLELGDEEDFA